MITLLESAYSVLPLSPVPRRPDQRIPISGQTVHLSVKAHLVGAATGSNISLLGRVAIAESAELSDAQQHLQSPFIPVSSLNSAAV